ncbi:MAG: S41 family peptidase [Patescibacteria group bacterium]|nr:S41 family peptidase [Patescibacteria group bacterium]MBU1870552.1 S41 family peptidase [Patescibacteria group bacterium]
MNSIESIKEFCSFKKKRCWFKWLGLIILILFTFIAGMIFTQKSEIARQFTLKKAEYTGQILNKYGLIPRDKLSQDVDFNLFWNVWDLLHEQYVEKDKLNEKQMFYGALRGLTASLNDPYTVFMDPKVAEEFANDLTGTFEGIGAELGIKNNILTIIAPLAEMPAEKAGLKAGDKIYAINGISTAGITIDEAVSKIRGPKDTEVTLIISRNGLDKARDVKIKRGIIVVKSVNTEMRTDEIFVVRISNFNDDTQKLFKKAVVEIIAKNPKGIILDLRNNPGGYLDTAIEVASEWVEDEVVVTEKFTEEKKNEYLARGRARLKDFPTVILVNQGSASASEIVAGALKDTEKAIIVGKKTFGKGSVQTLKELKDGSSVKVTVAKWLTPKGNCINDQGIMPDVEIDLTIENFNNLKDPQLDKALEILKK